MTEDRCWICGRSKEELSRDLPANFWDEQIGHFKDIEVLGKICSVDRVLPGDPSYSKHFIRKDGAPDEACAFDDRRWAIIKRKVKTIKVCRICLTVDLSLRLLDEGREYLPHHVIYTTKNDEAVIAGVWQKMKEEDKKMEKEFPEESYRLLCALQKVNPGSPISLWDLSNLMRVFNHRELEAPLLHILNQAPDLGSYERKSMSLHFSSPEIVQRTVPLLIRRYEQYYDRDKRTPEEEKEHQRVMGKIKRLDSLRTYQGWAKH